MPVAPCYVSSALLMGDLLPEHPIVALHIAAVSGLCCFFEGVSGLRYQHSLWTFSCHKES